jgi:hypothetical protein
MVRPVKERYKEYQGREMEKPRRTLRLTRRTSSGSLRTTEEQTLPHCSTIKKSETRSDFFIVAGGGSRLHDINMAGRHPDIKGKIDESGLRLNWYSPNTGQNENTRDKLGCFRFVAGEGPEQIPQLLIHSEISFFELSELFKNHDLSK